MKETPDRFTTMKMLHSVTLNCWILVVHYLIDPYEKTAMDLIKCINNPFDGTIIERTQVCPSIRRKRIVNPRMKFYFISISYEYLQFKTHFKYESLEFNSLVITLDERHRKFFWTWMSTTIISTHITLTIDVLRMIVMVQKKAKIDMFAKYYRFHFRLNLGLATSIFVHMVYAVISNGCWTMRNEWQQ